MADSRVKHAHSEGIVMAEITLQSKLFSKTAHASATDGGGINAQLLERGGYISQLSAGVYSLLPLGVRVLTRIEAIIREEMVALGAQEVLLPALHSRVLWEATGRWDSVDVLYKLTCKSGKDFCLGPTHEEVITPLAAQFIRSLRDLPCALFQIQTKFRDELRARSGLLRGREFRMKDMYSFHRDVASLEDFYREVMEGYSRVFARLGFSPSTQLDAKGRVAFTYAGGGSFSRYSHEYQLISEFGEDTIYVTPDGSVAFNKEVISDHDMVRALYAGELSELQEVRAIEIGNIFQLGTRFSEAVGMSLVDESGRTIHPVMGCYGIGATRLLGALVEIFHDTRGIIWPRSVAPFDAHIVLVSGASLSVEHAQEISRHLPHDWSVVVDDREKIRVGEKFADADLYGAPLRITIGRKYLEGGIMEIKMRDEEHCQEVSLIELCNHITTHSLI